MGSVLSAIEIDWDEILRLYAQGIQTGRELARMFNVSEGTVRARARKAGIKPPTRSKRVLGRVDDALDRHTAGPAAVSARDVEDALVRVGRDVVLEHRSTIKQAMAVVRSLLDDITRVTAARETIEGAVLALIDASGAERDSMHVTTLIDALAAAVDLAGKSRATQSLSASLRALVGLERQAFNLPAQVTADGTAAKGGDLQQLMDELNGADTGF